MGADGSADLPRCWRRGARRRGMRRQELRRRRSRRSSPTRPPLTLPPRPRPTVGADHGSDDDAPPTTLPPTHRCPAPAATAAPTPHAGSVAAERARARAGEPHRLDQHPEARHQHGAVRGRHAHDAEQGPGHWPGTALPSQTGNVVVAGHRVTHSRPFRNIDQLGPGDQVHLHDRERTAHVRVRRQRDREAERDVHRQPIGGQDGDALRVPSAWVSALSLRGAPDLRQLRHSLMVDTEAPVRRIRRARAHASHRGSSRSRRASAPARSWRSRFPRGDGGRC